MWITAHTGIIRDNGRLRFSDRCQTNLPATPFGHLVLQLSAAAVLPHGPRSFQAALFDLGAMGCLFTQLLVARSLDGGPTRRARNTLSSLVRLPVENLAISCAMARTGYRKACVT